MIPNITRGKDFRGVVKYLVGPGRANEHTRPHMVAGDSCAQQWIGADVLSAEDAGQIAARLEAPTLVRGSQPAAGSVWHCSLSIRADDGRLGDDVWSRVARDFMNKMGWIDPATGEAAMPWVAIHHGASKAGNDHIHLVVSMVRDDGRIVDTRNDFQRAQQACRAVETELELTPLEGHEIGLGRRGLTPAEHATQAATGREPARRTLERIVRAAAARADTEAEFVEYLRDDGVVVAPYFAKGGSRVTGYKVRLDDGGQIWFAGGKLARDLSLPRLRETWAAGGAADSAPVAAWTGRPVSGPARLNAPSEAQIGQAIAAIDKVTSQAEGDPAARLAQWATVSHDLAGTFAALSRAIEGDEPGPLAAAAQAASRLGQLHRRNLPGTGRPRTRMAGAARVGYALGRTRGRAGTRAFVRQLVATLYALAAAAKAMQQATIAEKMLAAARNALPPLAATTAGSFGAVPQPLWRSRAVTAARATAGRGDGPGPGR